jgi:hypothetical protein
LGHPLSLARFQESIVRCHDDYVKHLTYTPISAQPGEADEVQECAKDQFFDCIRNGLNQLSVAQPDLLGDLTGVIKQCLDALRKRVQDAADLGE